jgi:hypothetical protein
MPKKITKKALSTVTLDAKKSKSLQELLAEIEVALKIDDINVHFFRTKIPFLIMYLTAKILVLTIFKKPKEGLEGQALTEILAFLPQIDDPEFQKILSYSNLSKAYTHMQSAFTQACHAINYSASDDCMEQLNYLSQSTCEISYFRQAINQLLNMQNVVLKKDNSSIELLYNIARKTYKEFLDNSFYDRQMILVLQRMIMTIPVGILAYTTGQFVFKILDKTVYRKNKKFSRLDVSWQDINDEQSAIMQLDKIKKLNSKTFEDSFYIVAGIFIFALITMSLVDPLLAILIVPILLTDLMRVIYLRNNEKKNTLELKSVFENFNSASFKNKLSTLGYEFTCLTQKSEHVQKSTEEYFILELTALKNSKLAAQVVLQALITLCRNAGISVNNFENTRCYIPASKLLGKIDLTAILSRWYENLLAHHAIADARLQVKEISKKLSSYIQNDYSYPINTATVPRYAFEIDFYNKQQAAAFLAISQDHCFHARHNNETVMFELAKSFNEDVFITIINQSLQVLAAIPPSLPSLQTPSASHAITIVDDDKKISLNTRKDTRVTAHAEAIENITKPTTPELPKAWNYHSRQLTLYPFFGAKRFLTQADKQIFTAMALTPEEVQDDNYYAAVVNTLEKGNITTRQNKQGMAFLNGTMFARDQTKVPFATLDDQIFPIFYKVKTLGKNGDSRAFARKIEENDKIVYAVCAVAHNYHKHSKR